MYSFIFTYEQKLPQWKRGTDLIHTANNQITF